MPEYFFSYLKKIPKFWQPVVNIFAGKPASHHQNHSNHNNNKKFFKKLFQPQQPQQPQQQQPSKWTLSSCKYAERSCNIRASFSPVKSLEN